MRASTKYVCMSCRVPLVHYKQANDNEYYHIDYICPSCNSQYVKGKKGLIRYY